MSLISLAYVSAASREMTQQDLTNILSTARNFNQRQNITGMLLYRNGYFIQALEGAEDKVMSLYNKIAQDERHRGVLKVHTGKVKERSFSNWSMGFHNLDGENKSELKGYTDFLDQPFDSNILSKNRERALILLELFKDGSAY